MYFLTKFCGICLKEHKEVQNISNNDTDSISLVEKLKYCCFEGGCNMDDLPIYICYKCGSDLKIAFSFKKMCLANITIFKQYVSILKNSENNENAQLMVKIENSNDLPELVCDIKIEKSEIKAFSDEDSNTECMDVDSVPIKIENIEIKPTKNEILDDTIDIKYNPLQDINLVPVKDEINFSFNSDTPPNTNSALKPNTSTLFNLLTQPITKPYRNQSEFSSTLLKTPSTDLKLTSNSYSSNQNTFGAINLKNNSINVNQISNPRKTNNNLASKVPQTSSNGALNLLNASNDQVSHFLNPNEIISTYKASMSTSTNVQPNRNEFSTLRSLLETSTAAQSRVVHLFKSQNYGTSNNDDSGLNPSRINENNEVLQMNEDEMKLNLNNSSFDSTSIRSNAKSKILHEDLCENIFNTPLPQFLSNTPLLYPSATNVHIPINNSFVIICHDSAQKEAATKNNSNFDFSSELNNTNTPITQNIYTTVVPNKISDTYILPTQDSTVLNIPKNKLHSTEVVASGLNCNNHIIPTQTTTAVIYPSKNSDSPALPTFKNISHNPKPDLRNKLSTCGLNFAPININRGYSCAPVSPTPAAIPPNVNLSQNKLYSCPVCKKEFLKNMYLRQHFEMHYSIVDQQVVSATNLLTNKMLKTRNLAKRYQCDFCFEIFSELGDFKKHIKVHVGEKKFECKNCKKRFSQLSELSKHIVSHNDDRVHQCFKCNKFFPTDSRLEKHFLKYHIEK